MTENDPMAMGLNAIVVFTNESESRARTSGVCGINKSLALYVHG